MHLVQNSETYVIYAKSLFVKEENLQNMGTKSQNKYKYIYERYKIWVLAYHGQQSSDDWWPTIGSVERLWPTISRCKGHHSGTCGNMIARHSGDFDWLILITNKS